MNIATKIVDLFDWKGDAALYRLAPPLPHGEYVIVSAIDLAERRNSSPELAMFDFFAGIDRTEETMIFAAFEDGQVTDWGELAVVPVQSHMLALMDLGYEVIEA